MLAYKNLGALLAPRACPTQDAARHITLASGAYNKSSGHFLSSKQFDLPVKLQATAALVDATLLHGSELWAPLADGPAARIEAAHMRWLRKATNHFRSVEHGRLTDAEVCITYEVPSTYSLITRRRLAYLSSFGKASPFCASSSAACRTDASLGLADAVGYSIYSGCYA